MWIEAVDDLLLLLRHEGITKEVASLSVSAQQHGSVYLHSKAAARLKDLDHRKPLTEQTVDIFSRPVAPVWMDSSTSEECEEIAQAMGGDARLAEISGNSGRKIPGRTNTLATLLSSVLSSPPF
jgi:xylulokinase